MDSSIKTNRMIGKAVVYTLLALAALFILLPLLFLVINSFKGQSEIVRNPLALPESWTLDYIKNAIESIHFGKAVTITIFFRLRMDYYAQPYKSIYVYLYGFCIGNACAVPGYYVSFDERNGYAWTEKPGWPGCDVYRI